jgi:hypothetical protein
MLEFVNKLFCYRENGFERKKLCAKDYANMQKVHSVNVYSNTIFGITQSWQQCAQHVKFLNSTDVPLDMNGELTCSSVPWFVYFQPAHWPNLPF